MTDAGDASGQTSASETDSALRVNGRETHGPSNRLWIATTVAILIAGAFLRLYDLDLVPLHHDEGVNGNFLLQLVRKGFYQYDPQNYHGPTLYYFAAVIPWCLRLIFGNSAAETYGLNTFAIRFVTAAFGVATIWLVLTLRQRIGRIAALSGAALLVISPGAVYLSRYFIHETLLVFFTLLLITTALRFYESAKQTYLLLAAAATALLFATKETAIITAGVLLIALAMTTILARLREFFADKDKPGNASATLRDRLRFTIARFGGLMSLAILFIAALSLFLTIDILFYSSFFTNYPKGLFDALKTFDFWAKAGTRDHRHPWWTYFAWMFKEESPLLILGSAGVVLAIWRGSNRFAVFTAFWILGTFAAYSLIPYKTPWLALNFLVPLAIMGGYALEEIWKQARAGKGRLLALVVAVLVAGVSGYQMFNLNFIHYDDDRYVYVYAHTRRQMIPILEEIDRAAKRAGTGGETVISIVSPEFWPLPWYLRHYSWVRYGTVDVSDDPIVIGSEHQQLQLMGLANGRYVQIKSHLNPAGTFPLRPKVELVLFVRKDLAIQNP